MRIRKDPGLTFDDVLLIPRHSRVASRKDVLTEVDLLPGIRLAIPIISANMDTVTEVEMAIAMARIGGMGFIHRFMDIERQAAQVARVKRSEGYIVDKPLTIRKDATIAFARLRMDEAGIGGLVVVDDEDCVIGMLTRRDLLLAPNQEDTINDVMVPREHLITVNKQIGLDEARRILHQERLEKLPIIDEKGRLAGLITAQDIIKIQRYPNATKDDKGRLRVGAAVGAKETEFDRAQECLKEGADLVVVDIAHGHSENCLGMVKQLKSQFPEVPLIAGNVATPEGVKDLAKAGADAVKVGIGAGSICITRVVTGFGVPQLTAILECAEVAREIELPIISDGGIRNSGDIVKALAAGASAVMVGSLLAGTEEAPGATVIREGRKYKIVRGMASYTANVDRSLVECGAEPQIEYDREIIPEGVEAVVPYRGTVNDILHQLIGGLRSGMSYAGAETIEMLWERSEFVRLTQSGIRESGTHDVHPLW